MVCNENQLKPMRQSIKDTMQVEDDEGMYDQDMEQDNAFLAVVLNTVLIGDIKWGFIISNILFFKISPQDLCLKSLIYKREI